MNFIVISISADLIPDTNPQDKKISLVDILGPSNELDVVDLPESDYEIVS